MSNIAIRVEGLGKRYRLGQRASYRRLTESLTDLATAPFRARRQRADVSIKQRNDRELQDDGTFWALNDVSFEIKQGEVVGIIGRNGAGKSTLLKILSRITEPTKGDVWLYGRVASLLEVGTGFHPELTGRENIFLNGAILGMRRREILHKFDEIVAFSEVEKFLDTPVKHYSSGMYMRLAFSVAAHLEPEILLVDEVLAVGDAQFQAKCIGKMGDVAKTGRTVLFVSHNMAAVTQLCRNAISLKNGTVHAIGSAEAIIADYLRTDMSHTGVADLSSLTDRTGSGEVRFRVAILSQGGGQNCGNFSIGDDIQIDLEVDCQPFLSSVKLAVELSTAAGLRLANMVDVDSGFSLSQPTSLERIRITLKDIRLYPGDYLLGFWAGSLTSTECYDHLDRCIHFSVDGGGKRTTRPLPQSAGLIFLTPEWIRSADFQTGQVNLLDTHPGCEKNKF